MFGLPWAALGGRSFIYIKDKPSSYVVVATIEGGDIAQMSRRDFVIQFNFDSDGVMTGYERYKDSGDRDYCFTNGICFSQATDNVLLQPQSERHLPTEDRNCTIYLFRDDVEGSWTYNSYIDVILTSNSRTPAKKRALVGVSVAHGVNQWSVEPSSDFEMMFDFAGVKHYPFKASIKEAKRPPSKIRFACEVGKNVYVRLAVPRSLRKVNDFEIVDESTAELAIKNLPVLMSKYTPNMLKQ